MNHISTEKYKTHDLLYHRHFISEEDYKNDELFKKLDIFDEDEVYVGKEDIFIQRLGKCESRNAIKVYRKRNN